jgi:4-alpha-glucanotransferase
MGMTKGGARAGAAQVPEDRIETHYLDALQRKHASPKKAIDAIRKAMHRVGRSGDTDVVVVTEGEILPPGDAAITLEDGTKLRPRTGLPSDLPIGYHDLRRADGSTARLIVAPRACHLPESLKIWGWAIQLYAARSRRSWGIGDFADLRRLGQWASKQGAGIALINPLAAAAPTIPQQASPYFPSTRRFRSPLYLRVEEVEGAKELADLPAIAERARAMNSDRQIDRDEVFQLKSGALDRIWESVREHESEGFERFRTMQGAGLREFATYCALAERFQSGWRQWPKEFRHPGSDAIKKEARRKPMADRIRFHEWLQYQIERQLNRASRAMPVMQDLPIGFDANGADAWAFQDVLAEGISVGAPPDEFNTRGQNWGLPPFVPRKLRGAGYGPFIDTIRACVRGAGGLRIDHVMGLFRLFWIPEGMEPKDGAYVRSRGDELLAIVAIESQRAGAVIVGEDLGTVEEEARTQLMARKIMSYRLLWFEKEPPAKFPEQALAAITTHDLPTVAGMWSGSDLRAQQEIGLSPNVEGTRQIHRHVGRLTKSTAKTPVKTVIARLHESLAAAPSRIITATLDDAMAVEERPNMPATSDEWPNWSIALPAPIETLEKNPLAARIARVLGKSRRQVGDTQS